MFWFWKGRANGIERSPLPKNRSRGLPHRRIRVEVEVGLSLIIISLHVFGNDLNFIETFKGNI